MKWHQPKTAKFAMSSSVLLKSALFTESIHVYVLIYRKYTNKDIIWQLYNNHLPQHHRHYLKSDNILVDSSTLTEILAQEITVDYLIYVRYCFASLTQLLKSTIARTRLSVNAPIYNVSQVRIQRNIKKVGHGIEVTKKFPPSSSLFVPNIVVSRSYDTAGIRKKYHNIQTIELSGTNF